MLLQFEVRGLHTNDEKGVRIGNIFYGTKGWVWIDGDGRKWQSYLGRKEEKGPGADAPAEKGGSDPNVLTSIETPHYANFVEAIRAGDPKKLTCDILEGHLSSTLPHLANISYRVGRSLTFDGKTETCTGDAEARPPVDPGVPPGLRGSEVVRRHDDGIPVGGTPTARGSTGCRA